MELGSIYFYPVKSTSGHEVGEAEVQPWGLAGDRRYLVVDERGRPMTAREHPIMLACVAEPDGGAITLTGPHAAPLRVTPTSRRFTVDVWGTPGGGHRLRRRRRRLAVRADRADRQAGLAGRSDPPAGRPRLRPAARTGSAWPTATRCC